MKYVITESQYNKLFDRYISREFDGAEKKTLSTKYQYSIFWIKDGNIVAEIKNNEYFIIHKDIWKKIGELFALNHSELQFVFKHWLEKHHNLTELKLGLTKFSSLTSLSVLK
jgi:hypothetical protein